MYWIYLALGSYLTDDCNAVGLLYIYEGPFKKQTFFAKISQHTKKLNKPSLTKDNVDHEK